MLEITNMCINGLLVNSLTFNTHQWLPLQAAASAKRLPVDILGLFSTSVVSYPGTLLKIKGNQPKMVPSSHSRKP